MPVSSDEVTVPGSMSQLRSMAWPWSEFSQPASWAVCAALASRPAATSTRMAAVKRKNFCRLMRTPPR